MRRFVGLYLLSILALACAYTPIDLVKERLVQGKMTFVIREDMGDAPIWYNFRDATHDEVHSVIDYEQLLIRIGLISLIFVILYLILPKHWFKKI